MVLSKLPSTLQLPETRTMIHEVRETRISTAEVSAHETKEDNETERVVKSTDEADGDLV